MLATSNRNLITFANAYASQAKLSNTQIRDVEDFTTVSTVSLVNAAIFTSHMISQNTDKVQAIKLYTALLVVENRLEKWKMHSRLLQLRARSEYAFYLYLVP